MSGWVDRIVSVETKPSNGNGKSKPTFPPSDRKIMQLFGRSLSDFFAYQSRKHDEGEPLQDPFKQLPSVYACVTARSRPLAMCPLKLYKRKEVQGEVEYEEVTSNPILDLITNPNPYMTRYQLTEGWETSVVLSGENTFFLDRKSFTAIPREMWSLPAHRLEPIRDSKGIPVAWSYTPGGKHSAIRYELYQIMREKLWDPADPIRGLSPLEPLDIVLQSEWAALQFNHFFLKTGCDPGGRYQIDGMATPDQMEMVLHQHTDKYEGPDKVGRSMIDEGGMKWVKNEIPHKDASFIDGREMNLRDIAMATGNNNASLGLPDLNYAQITEQLKHFWTATLIPRVRAMEDAWYAFTEPILGPDYELLFDLTKVEALAANVKEKAETAEKLVKIGLPISEANRILDMGVEEFEGWDEPYALRPGPPALPNPKPAKDGGPEKEAKALPVEAMDIPIVSDADMAYNQKWDDEVLTPLEKKFRDKIKRWVNEHRNETLTKFGKITGWSGKDLKPRSWRGAMLNAGEALPNLADYKDEPVPAVSFAIAEILPSLAEQGKALAKFTGPLYEEAILRGAKARAASLGTAQQITEIRGELAKWLKIQKDEIEGVGQTIADQLTASLREGIKEGETLAELAGRIKHIHKGAANRAMTISRTEVGRAANHGAYEESKESGVVEGHVWVTGGANIRDSHAAIHGQYRKIGVPFSNGLLYPQDPAGPAGEVINCKCNLRERLTKE